jgi:hypothetical protein
MRYVSVFMLLALVTLSAFAQERDLSTGICSVRNLPTEIPPGLTEIGIQGHLLAVSNYSSAVLGVRNLSPKAIIALQLVLEYYGANSQRFGDVIAQTVAKEIPTDESIAIGKGMDRGSVSKVLSHMVLPDETVTVDGSGWFATGICPVRAKLTAAVLWFSDGSSLHWSMPDSRIDPESHDLQLRDLPNCLVQHNMDRLSLTLELDKAGRVQNARAFPPDAAEQDPCDLREIDTWRFEPALVDGKPAAAKLNLLLRLFESDRVSEFGVLGLSAREASHALTVIDALAPSSEASPWHILYAGMVPQISSAH